jgi:hypothetical protein
MAQRQKPKPYARSSGVALNSKQAPIRLLDQQLNRILSRLADLLLRHGYGYQRVNKLTRSAFVKAAQEIGKREQSRTSIARIAALTGLTRIEVSRLLRADCSARSEIELDMNRATRVAHGWRSDPMFSDEGRRPRPLPFSGRRSFSNLVRKFSGDIPARAMLLEMKRLGMVRQSSNDTVSLVRRDPIPARSTIEAMRAIAPWIDLLTEANNPLESTNLSATTQQLRIYFESQSQVLASVRELEARRRSFVSSVEQLGTTKRISRGFELTVTVAVAAAQPTQTRLRRLLGEKKGHEGKEKS